MARTPAMRKTLSAPGLLKEARACFDRIEDRIASRGPNQTVMSGLAVFGLKYASLLKFEKDAHADEAVRSNLATLYGIERAPSDTACVNDSMKSTRCGIVSRNYSTFCNAARGWEGTLV